MKLSLKNKGKMKKKFFFNLREEKKYTCAQAEGEGADSPLSMEPYSGLYPRALRS